MTENTDDSTDELEDQLANVADRTKEKLSEQDRKKAEKLGVDATASAANEAEKPASSADAPVVDDATERTDTASEGDVYEYDETTEMNAELDHETGPVAVDAGVEQTTVDGTLAQLSRSGERMAVTKTETEDVTGTDAETKESEKTKFLYFELNDELFATPLESISSVEELSGLTRYPRSPEPIDGVTDMRGKIIAVLNPKVIVDLSNATHEQGEGGEYIIVQEELEDEHRIGVRVDDVSHVETATEEAITPIYDITEMDLVRVDETYLEGIIHGYRDDDRAQVPWIDFDALVDTLKEY